LNGELAARGLEGSLRDVTMISPDRCVFARAVEIAGLAIESDPVRIGVPMLISVAWTEGERVRSDDLTLEDIVTNHPKLSELKRLTHGGSRTLYTGENTSLNAGYALLSEQSTEHPFTAFDKYGTVHRLPYAFIDSVYANPSLIASNNSLEEAGRLFRLPPPPTPGELPPAVHYSIANSMLGKRSTESDRALLSAAAAYCRRVAVTALRATAEVHSRHTLATGTLDGHVKKVAGFKKWLTLETERLDLQRFGEKSGRLESEAQTKAQAEFALF
jgi:hypothetical protein